MNIVMLAIGFGAGSLLTSLLMLWVIGQASKPSEKGKEHMKVTEDLLRERNEINSRIDGRLATLQEWALQNWKPL